MRIQRMISRQVAFVVVLAVAAVASSTRDARAQAIELEPVAQGLERPLLVTHAGDGSGRLFFVEQGGRILIHDGARLLETPFLDLSTEVTSGGERGLLGLAFHPDYVTNGFFFVNYTDRSGDTVVSRFAATADPNRADRSSEREVLSIRQPFSNHNGGHLAFGPDGHLYIGSGDGGSGGDPQNNGQRLDTLLGKLLRLDVDRLPATVPTDNPFVADPAARGEIWAYGLRNPWRFSFDRRTGDLFLGDVGQNLEEEIDFQPAASSGGENYGWRRMEGSRCFDPPSGCQDPTLTLPILVYGHGPECSVTAGFRYRGSRVPALRGAFLFGDFCSGVLWAARPGAGGLWSAAELADTRLKISSFGEDEEGELYVVDHGGAVFRLAGSLILLDGFESGDTSGWDKTRHNVTVVEPGLGGSRFALEATVDGSSEKSFVLTKRPRRQQTLAVTFLLGANAVDLGDAELDLLQLMTGARKVLARLTLESRGSAYLATLRVRQNNGNFLLVGSTKVKRRRVVALGVEWARASEAESADGLARLLRGGRVRAQRLDLTTGRLILRSVRVGLPAGSAGAIGGSILLDEFVITR